MTKTVVILGAGWAGLPLAFKLLKYTLPKIQDLKVILVSPNSHFYWNVAATRGVIPGSIPDDSLFLPIETGFSQYSVESFEFVLGKATHLDVEKNSIELTLNGGSSRSLVYDQLVVATGSHVKNNLPFKPIGTHEETLAALHDLQKHIEAASSIVVAGGGPTGVETAGELAAAYGSKKDITLIVGSEQVLNAAATVSASVRKVIEQDLKKLGVRLVFNTQVKHAETAEAGDEPSKTTLSLLDGSSLVTDLYLPLFGVELNTGFVPEEFLDKTGSLILENNMRLKGTQNVWGIGDVGNIQPKQLTVTDAQIIYLAGALDSVLTTGKADGVKDYKPDEKTMVFVSMGKKHATGQIGNWRLWGWIVSYVKGRNLFVDTAPGYVGGKALRHASM